MRTVRLEHSAQGEYDRCVKKHSRFEDIYGGMEWLLANDPETQGIVYGKFRVCIHGSNWGELPALAVVYAFDDEKVMIHGVKVFDNSES